VVAELDNLLDRTRLDYCNIVLGDVAGTAGCKAVESPEAVVRKAAVVAVEVDAGTLLGHKLD
jgi:hypothetical protein